MLPGTTCLHNNNSVFRDWLTLITFSLPPSEHPQMAVSYKTIIQWLVNLLLLSPSPSS